MIDFYYFPASSPCRASMLTAKAVGVELNLKLLDLFAGQSRTSKFLAINPQHCVPTLVDGDFTLWESRPICTYLVVKYGEDDSLYPCDVETRATVDRLLYFDSCTLYPRAGDYVFPVIYGKTDQPDPEKLEKLHEALGWLDGFLEDQDYAVGDLITVADHSLVATVSSCEAVGIDLSEHENVTAWLARCKENMPGYNDVNEPGAQEFGKMFKAKLE